MKNNNQTIDTSMKIKIDDIEIKYNPRKCFEGIDELANNIKELGLIQPLTVAANGDGKFVLLDGQRRLQALRKLKWPEVDVVLRPLDDQQQKEVPIATDFFKDKLKLSERAVGVANLINREKKVTKETLAKRYGWKVREVETLLKLASLQPNILEMIDNGRLEIDQAIALTLVKRDDIQLKAAEFMTGKNWCTLLGALENIAYELPFDDVFTFEQAKKDNQVGIVIRDEDNECDRVFTYDKDYYDQKSKEYEEREQRSYDERMSSLNANRQGHSEEVPDQKELTKEERKALRQEAKSEYDKTLVAFRESTKTFLHNKPSNEQLSQLIEKFISRITIDNARLILKSFGVNYKASDMKSSDYRLRVSQIISEMVKNESQLSKLIIYVDFLSAIYKSTLFDFDGVKKMIVKMDQNSETTTAREVIA